MFLTLLLLLFLKKKLSFCVYLPDIPINILLFFCIVLHRPIFNRRTHPAMAFIPLAVTDTAVSHTVYIKFGLCFFLNVIATTTDIQLSHHF